MIETLEGFGGLSERRVRFVVEIEKWEERVFMRERERGVVAQKMVVVFVCSVFR